MRHRKKRTTNIINPLKQKVMKRLAMTIAATLIIALSAGAQKLTGIRAEARYITDMMVAELGLTSAQHNSILNINLAYLNGINSYRDIQSRQVFLSPHRLARQRLCAQHLLPLPTATTYGTSKQGHEERL